MARTYSVGALCELLNLAKKYAFPHAAFVDAGHTFASLIVTAGSFCSTERIISTIDAYPDIDPIVIGAVLSVHLVPDFLSHIAPESIRGGLVFPNQGWSVRHVTDLLTACRAAADPDLLEAFRCAHNTVSHTPATESGWLVHVLSAPTGAERVYRALRAAEYDAIHPEVVFGIVVSGIWLGNWNDCGAAAQTLAGAFERLADPPRVLLPLILPPIII